MDANANVEPDELAQRRIGELLSEKWRLEKLLGVGGMAAVYAAKHVNNDRAAAIKVLHVEASLNAEIKRRFLREGFIANKVQHPGAVAVLDDGVTSDGAAYIVMELCQGETLQEVLEREGTCDEATVLRWAEALLDVLALAHQEGIVHRDLKPENVFVLRDGSVKVLDFGVARIESLSDHRTQAGLVLGTPAFMPPEQARGQTVDGRSDLWALGAIMVTALTGKRVREANTTQECLFLAMTEPVKPMAVLAPELSPRLGAIIDKALAFEPAKRWDDATTMQSAVHVLQQALARDPTLLAKSRVKAAWPPPPVVPGPPIAPRASATNIPISRVPTKVEPSDPATVEALGATMPAPANAAEIVANESKQALVPEPTPSASEVDALLDDAQDVPSRPPVAAHLQAEARSLEEGSPLLKNPRRNPLRTVPGMIALLVSLSFGAAALIQHSAAVRGWLALEPEPSDDEPVASLSLVPTVIPTASAEPTAEPIVDAGIADAEPTVSTPDASASHGVAARPPVTRKPAVKPPPKKPPKKRR